MEKYNPSEVENKWKEKWEKNPPYISVDPPAGGKKFYALVEFPYCSGEGLHMGHAFTNTMMDVIARKKRMDGFNVLHPMGWDSFGLPTENYAIKTGIQPAEITARNTKRFKETDNRLGISYNWEREIDTSDPKYYRWTQWIFIQMFKKGLAYKAETPVGWCPSCKIILANEEIVGGKCERCGAEAEHRLQKQWILRITAYADRLADELDLVDYPDYVKKSQRDWIGRSEGTIIKFKIKNLKLKIKEIPVFTTRPDTLFGVTAVVISPEHPIVASLLNSKSEIRNSKIKDVKNYVENSKKKSELERIENKEKTGVFTGYYCINPINNESIPVWIGDYVIGSYGGGAIMVVPAHDQRDYEFAKKYGLAIKEVIFPNIPKFPKTPKLDKSFEDYGFLLNSGEFTGQPSKEAIRNITKWLEEHQAGNAKIQFHLRDWIFSRQHYWGEPIPVVYCEHCAKTTGNSNIEYRISNINGKEFAIIPVPEKDLPVKLPYVEKYQPTETGESPLAKIKNWVNVACPECGKPARRETDTMPNWAGSSWYYLRYCDPKNNSCLADPKKLKYWLAPARRSPERSRRDEGGVDIYLGGAEHNTLHLLYSRFWHKFLNDIGVVPGKEPYASRRQHGVILGEDGFRMSKSRGNIINPDEMINAFGADTIRIYLMFMGPYDSTMPWETSSVEGSHRFLKRVWNLALQGSTLQTLQTTESLKRVLNKTIKKVGEDIDKMKFNTAIAAMMEFINVWQNDKDGLSKEDLKKFLLILAPFAPFITEELWQHLEVSRVSRVSQVSRVKNSRDSRGTLNSIHSQSWPSYDESLLKEEEVTIVIQVNGKVRGEIRIKNNESRIKETVEDLAKQEQGVLKYLKGKEIKKVIFLPGRLINFVI